jgi:UDP-glucose 4-epimerase
VKIEGKRVLVTGGAGFIGSHLVDRLASTNQVTVLDDFSVGDEQNLTRSRRRIKVLRADVRDPASVRVAIKGADVVFHLAVVCLRATIGEPLSGHLVNDFGTLNLLMAARESNVERFVYVSSSEVYGSALHAPMDEDHPLNPMTPYAASKLAGEAYALSFHRTYGLPAMVVRPFNAYGPREHLDGPSGEVIPRFVAWAMAGRPLVVFGDGLQTRDFTWVTDTVRGIVLAAECDELIGGRVNIARGQEVSVLRVAHLVQEIVGRRVSIQHLAERPGDVRRHFSGVKRAQELLGFSARVGIEEGIASYIDWARTMREQGLGGANGVEVWNWQTAAATA